MFREFRTNLLLFALLMLLTGFGYPMLTLGLSQNLFPSEANGSLIKDQDRIIGSHLIGQDFTHAAYFHGRPSAAGTGYDATQSGGSNLSPTDPKLLEIVSQRVSEFKTANSPLLVPVDLITSSASGLDPHISPASARFQAARVASERHMPITQVEKLIASHIEGPSVGFIGEKRVNVLELNLALDQLPLAPASSNE
jgi:K+-transporting ATPase ATPase C chain